MQTTLVVYLRQVAISELYRLRIEEGEEGRRPPPVVFLAKHRRRPEIDNPEADDCLMIAESPQYLSKEVLLQQSPHYPTYSNNRNQSSTALSPDEYVRSLIRFHFLPRYRFQYIRTPVIDRRGRARPRDFDRKFPVISEMQWAQPEDKSSVPCVVDSSIPQCQFPARSWIEIDVVHLREIPCIATRH